MSAIGYLSARVIRRIDPLVGAACGAAAGAILGLGVAEGSNRASRIVALASLIFIPFRLCQKLQLPVSFKASVAMTGAIVALSAGIAFLVDKALEHWKGLGYPNQSFMHFLFQV